MSGKFRGRWRVGLLLVGLSVVVVVSTLVVFHASHSVKVGASSSLWPSAAGPGSTITVSGSGFLAHEGVEVYFQDRSQGVISTVTDAHGAFFVPLTVPKTYVRGMRYYVHVVVPRFIVGNSYYSTELLFNFIALHLSLSDAQGQRSFGSLVSFAGEGFVANEVVDLAWDEGAMGMSRAGTVVAGSDGSFTLSLTLPSVPYRAQVQLEAFGRSSHERSSISLSGSPGIVLTPSTGSAGTLVSLNGGGFGSDEVVNVLYLKMLVTTARTNIEGAFTASFTLGDSGQIGYEYDAIEAIGKTSGVSAAVSFVSQPSITIAPTSGKSGTKISVKGRHFTASDTLNIYWVDDSQGGSGTQTFLGNVRVSPKGTFTITITAPAGVVKGGVYVVQAIDSTTGQGAQAQFIGK